MTGNWLALIGIQLWVDLLWPSGSPREELSFVSVHFCVYSTADPSICFLGVDDSSVLNSTENLVPRAGPWISMNSTFNETFDESCINNTQSLGIFFFVFS